MVLKPAAASDEQSLLDRCKDALANYKIPKRVVFVEALPKNSMDKVVKRDLRERFAELATTIPGAREQTKEGR